MPAFCAAFGSFHPKSSVTYFVKVLTTVRVLPLLLTFTLICSSTLTVSTFGVRSYSDQRYWSMQTSGSGHASGASELAAGLAAFCTGSVGLTAANCTGSVTGCGIEGGSDKAALPLSVSATTGRDASLASFRSGSGVLNDAIATGTAAGCGIGGGSGKAALPLAISATETPCSSGAVARGASTCSARAVADVASLTSIGAPVLSMPSEPRPASPAPTQPARATVPHNAANTKSRRGLFIPRPPQVPPRSNNGFQSSVDDDCKPYGAATSRAARIIRGNSTTATTARSSRCDHNHYFIAQTLAHDEPPYRIGTN